MKFGVFDQIDATGRPLSVQYEERLQLAELCDQSGFHCYHQSEHHATPLCMAPSQSTFLAAVAQRTKRLRLCPLVYLLPIHHPLRLAEEICMLDHLSNGRFEFGIGRGANPHELEAMGVKADEAAEAYAESYGILQKYFTSDVLDHEGKFWTFRDVPVTMKPLQQPNPPVWYASATPESVVWPARNGVNVMCGGPADKVRQISDRYREEAVRSGLIGIMRWVVVAETDEQALAVAEAAWPRFEDSFYKLWRKHGTAPARVKMPDTFAGMLSSGMGIAGSPKTVLAALTEQLRNGRLNYFVGQFMFGDMPQQAAMESVRLFAAEVMPAVRNESAQWL